MTKALHNDRLLSIQLPFKQIPSSIQILFMHPCFSSTQLPIRQDFFHRFSFYLDKTSFINPVSTYTTIIQHTLRKNLLYQSSFYFSQGNIIFINSTLGEFSVLIQLLVRRNYLGLCISAMKLILKFPSLQKTLISTSKTALFSRARVGSASG